MTSYNSPMTKLDAVNICLSAMGEPVINSLDAAATDAQMAADIVDETSRSVQSNCWHWNNEQHTLSPTTDGYLMLPATTIRVEAVGSPYGINVIQRGGKLFNKFNNSYVFTAPLAVDLYLVLPFEDTPFSAKQFIAYRSARITQQRLLGSDTLYKMETADELKAWAVLMQEEAATINANMLTGSADTAAILTRWAYARGGV